MDVLLFNYNGEVKLANATTNEIDNKTLTFTFLCKYDIITL